VHLIGLVSHGGVHSSERHLRALVRIGVALRVSDIVVHAFTDGRDTSPNAGAQYVHEVEAWGGTRIGSVIGRYYAMDRDKRWGRTQRALDLLLDNQAEHDAATGERAVLNAYERGETDEFIAATKVGKESRIRPGDSVIAFNFRPDRMRQLTEKLGPLVDRYTTLTEYEEGWTWPVAFPPVRPGVTLPKAIAATGARQLHVAETEKYPHVTYFFGGGDEAPCAGEHRELVASPRDVATYDLEPQMSARAAADAFVAAWRQDAPRFGIINFANADMVGHTGVIPAAVTAIETVDACLGSVVDCVLSSGGALIVTADHGNADEMLEEDGSPDTAHSLNPVPLVVVTPDDAPVALRDGGVLADVAPTVLELLAIEQPAAMTGVSLLA
jgi:2,3-bisphosphoglycerate-independent phosphoglycerate mutase